MIGVIADDLTGAAELGAIGLRHGLHAEIVRSGKPSGKADLVCVDTDSRSCAPVEAGKRAAAAAKLLRAAGARWIYKKVDSVLRGHVTAEVEAVMKQLKLNRALLLPANPSLGRVIRDGQYFVRGKLIHKTEFARDPEYPRRVPQVLRLLKLPETFAIRMSNGDHSLAAGTIVVGEAATSEEVRDWAALRETDLLPAGGSEFFGALLAAENVSAPDGENESPKPAPGRELFVCGTSTESVRKFVAAARRRKQPVFSLPMELTWGAVAGHFERRVAAGARPRGGAAAVGLRRADCRTRAAPDGNSQRVCRRRRDVGGTGAAHGLAAAGGVARTRDWRGDAGGRGWPGHFADHQTRNLCLACEMDMTGPSLIQRG
jgi:uncharacterized protein YgbK (DUF1537 family)